MLHLFEPLGCLIKGRWRDSWRGQDLLLHGYFVDIWREDELFHDVPDDELCGAVAMTHTRLRHRLWNSI